MSFFAFSKQLLIATVLSFVSYSSFANHDAQSAESFQSVCIDSWMKKADKTTDKVDYKNFGEKYCTCASSQPLTTDEAIEKTIQLCMSRTLLHDAMDSLAEEVGLNEARGIDLDEYCQDRWNLVYPNQNSMDKKATTAYCECAKPKLLDLMKKTDNLTDKQYDESIDAVAAACSGNVKEEKTTASTVK